MWKRVRECIGEWLTVLGGIMVTFGLPIILFIMIITRGKAPETEKKPTFQETCVEEGGKLTTHHHDLLFIYDTYSCEK